MLQHISEQNTMQYRVISEFQVIKLFLTFLSLVINKENEQYLDDSFLMISSNRH